MVPLDVLEGRPLKTWFPWMSEKDALLKHGSPGCPIRMRFKNMVPLVVREGRALKAWFPWMSD